MSNVVARLVGALPAEYSREDGGEARFSLDPRRGSPLGVRLEWNSSRGSSLRCSLFGQHDQVVGEHTQADGRSETLKSVIKAAREPKRPF